MKILTGECSSCKKLQARICELELEHNRALATIDRVRGIAKQLRQSATFLGSVPGAGTFAGLMSRLADVAAEAVEDALG